jgi:CRP/FNR family transcriptional regulator
MSAGTTILREGQVCASVPFVVDGSIRVFKTAESGREITLYRITRGQSCVLSSGCGLGLPAFPASAVAEESTFAAFLPSDTALALMDESPSFRAFVLSQYASRLAEIMELVEEVAFRRVDERLRQFLLDASARSIDHRIAMTHQELADHIGTSREVVSRILKDWELRAALSISRGSIELRDDFESLIPG